MKVTQVGFIYKAINLNAYRESHFNCYTIYQYVETWLKKKLTVHLLNWKCTDLKITMTTPTPHVGKTTLNENSININVYGVWMLEP